MLSVGGLCQVEGLGGREADRPSLWCACGVFVAFAKCFGLSSIGLAFTQVLKS